MEEGRLIYEIRLYEAADGQADAMRKRFVNEVVPRLPNHGIELLGVFEDLENDSRLIYMTRFESEENRVNAWAAFGADPGWRAVKTATERDGPLLKSQTVSILSPTIAGLLLSRV